MAVNDKLPNTILDKTSVAVQQSFTCPDGNVVSDNECVPCPSGTFFDIEERVCSPCPIATFNKDVGKLQCEACPAGRVTETMSSTSAADCKISCDVGMYYDKIELKHCRPCGYGKYQPDEGKFSCRLCGLGLTTRTQQAVSVDECREECADGKELGIDGNCEPCIVGTYRTKGKNNYSF